MQSFKQIYSYNKFIGVIFVLLSLSSDGFGALSPSDELQRTLTTFQEVPISRNKIYTHHNLDGYFKVPPPLTMADSTQRSAIQDYTDSIANLRRALSDTEDFKTTLGFTTQQELIDHFNPDAMEALAQLDTCFENLCNSLGHKTWFELQVRMLKKLADKTYPIH